MSRLDRQYAAPSRTARRGHQDDPSRQLTVIVSLIKRQHINNDDEKLPGVLVNNKDFHLNWEAGTFERGCVVFYI